MTSLLGYWIRNKMRFWSGNFRTNKNKQKIVYELQLIAIKKPLRCLRDFHNSQTHFRFVSATKIFLVYSY